VALTSLMRVPRERRVELQAEALERIASARDNDFRRFLLAECLQAYSDLDPEEWERLKALLVTPKYKEAQPMGLTYYDHIKRDGIREGEALGERLALRRTAIRQLEAKFGPLSTTVKERLETLSTAQLDSLLIDIIKAQSLKELGLED
jgi:Domain of unknown function (DUF4351)